MVKIILFNPFFILILNRLWLFIVSYLSVLYLPFRMRPLAPSYRALPEIPFLDGWTRWDGAWYVSIATQGYYFNPDEQSNVAFFPLYPLTVRLFMFIFKNPYISGIIVSNLAFLAGSYFFYKLLYDHLLREKDKTFWSIASLIFFPYSFFFSAVYSESLFFMCAVLCFYYAERRNWPLSGIFGMFASADRFVGIALFPAILVKYRETYRVECRFTPAQNPSSSSLIKEGKRSWTQHAVPMISIGLIPLGMIGYMIFLYIKFGNPLAFAHTIGGGWEGMKTLRPDILLPFKSVYNTVINFNKLPDNKYHVIFQFPIFLFFLFMLYFVYKYLGTAYVLFSLVMVFIPSSVSINLISMGRYMLVIFPVFAVIPHVLKNRYLKIIILSFSFLILTAFTAMFSTWWWAG